MEFLQPSWLWGITGVIIPVIVHFWYQKKSKTIEWAASRWLTEKTSLQHRGLRLHDLLLLIIRCLIVILLAAILAKMVLLEKGGSSIGKTIHIIQPDEHVTDNFRFEIENALKKKEEIQWLGSKERVFDREKQIGKDEASLLHLQSMLNRLSGRYQHFNIYLSDHTILPDLPKVFVPGTFQIFSSNDSSGYFNAPYLQFGNKKVYADPVTHQLTTTENTKAVPVLKSAPAHRGNIRVLVDYRNAAESRVMQAALEALTDVYGIDFSIYQKAEPSQHYDWIASDRLPAEIQPRVFYIISGRPRDNFLPGNILQIPDTLRFPGSESVGAGRLPEMIGEAMVRHYRLASPETRLSGHQLARCFVQTNVVPEAQARHLRYILLLILIGLIALERWLAMGKKQLVGHA